MYWQDILIPFPNVMKFMPNGSFCSLDIPVFEGELRPGRGVINYCTVDILSSVTWRRCRGSDKAGALLAFCGKTMFDLGADGRWGAANETHLLERYAADAALFTSASTIVLFKISNLPAQFAFHPTPSRSPLFRCECLNCFGVGTFLLFIWAMRFVETLENLVGFL